MPMPVNILSNSDSTTGLRKYFKPYSPYSETYSSSDHFKRATTGTINYKVLFYTGNLLNWEGKAISVAEYFDVDGKCIGQDINSKEEITKWAIYGLTKNEIAIAIKNTLDEINNLGLGITFTITTRTVDGIVYYWEDTTDHNVLNSDRILILGRQYYEALKGAAIISVIAGVYLTIQGSLKYFNVSKEKNTGLRHELGHHLGLIHNTPQSPSDNKARPAVKDNLTTIINGTEHTFSFGNNDIVKYAFSREAGGYISKYTSGGTVESWVCAYDVIYNKAGNTRIYGDVSGVYPTINKTTFFGGGRHPDIGKNFYEYGRCRIYLVDGYKKEIMYELPIDYTGHFCFSLRVVPPLSFAPFYILATSKEFCHSFIHADTTEAATNKNTTYVITNKFPVETKYYICIKSHESTENNKPYFGKENKKGENWYNYWKEIESDDNRRNSAKEWKKKTDYIKYKSYLHKPLYGHIWYAIAGPLNDTNITITGDNYINSKITDGTVSGTLKIGGANGLKRVENIIELEEATGFKLKYTTAATEETDTKTAIEREIEYSNSNIDWSQVCKI